MIPRKELRFPVACPVTYSDYNLEHEGLLTDLSMGGCRILGAEGVAEGTALWVSASLPELQKPLEVELAYVQWVRGREFGLKTLVMASEDRRRLRMFIDERYRQQARERQAGRMHEFRASGAVEDPSMLCSTAGTKQGANPGIGAVAQDHGLGAPQQGLVPQIALGDLVVFMTWLEAAQRALSNGNPLPPVPTVEAGTVSQSLQFIHELYERAYKAHRQEVSLLPVLQAQESEVGSLLSDLHANLAALYEHLGHGEKAKKIRSMATLLKSIH